MIPLPLFPEKRGTSQTCEWGRQDLWPQASTQPYFPHVSPFRKHQLPHLPVLTIPQYSLLLSAPPFFSPGHLPFILQASVAFKCHIFFEVSSCSLNRCVVFSSGLTLPLNTNLLSTYTCQSLLDVRRS